MELICTECLEENERLLDKCSLQRFLHFSFPEASNAEHVHVHVHVHPRSHITTKLQKYIFCRNGFVRNTAGTRLDSLAK